MATTVLAEPPGIAAVRNGTRRAPWRSPDDQPRYARPALLAIAALGALLWSWSIDHSTYHSFYAVAARSMSESWKSFVFGSFDPANTITLDKLPGFLWPQALSARVFGFHPWSLTLPQVIEGVLSVLVLYKAVRRWAGANAALLACTLFTLTPVVAGLFRTAVEDPAFTLLLILAAEAAQRAAHTARLRPLLLAGVWVGLSFQTKMLEAWAVLPALAVVYLLAAPTTLRRRIGHVALAGLVTVAVSASWILLMTLTPAKDRPYVDGTTDNSAYSMVVGYNFLNRFSSVGLSAADTGSVKSMMGGGGGHAPGGGLPAAAGGTGGATAGGTGGATAGSPGGAGGFNERGTHGTHGTRQDTAYQGAASQGVGGQGAGGQTAGGQNASAKTMAARAVAAGGGRDDGGWTKMFGSQIASQTGWLYLLAALSLVLGVAWRRGRPRTDPLRAGFLMWGAWLAMFFLAFSAGSVGGHSYYMGVIATPLAALSGAGLVQLWRAYRAGGPRAWVLPVAITGTVAWAAYLASEFPSFRSWAVPCAIALGVGALALLGAAKLPRFAGRRIALVGALAGIGAMLITPAAWATSVLGSTGGMSGMMGTVGPAGRNGFGGMQTANPELKDALAKYMTAGGSSRHGGGQGGFGGDSTGLSSSQRKLYDYLKAHQGGASYLFAATSWSGASPFILATGEEVLPMGGFSGAAPSPTVPQFQQLVASGKLHYVQLGGSGRNFFGGGGSDSPTTAIQDWVKQSCTVVPASAYGGSADSSTGFGGFGGFGGGTASSQQLYRCG